MVIGVLDRSFLMVFNGFISSHSRYLKDNLAKQKKYLKILINYRLKIL